MFEFSQYLDIANHFLNSSSGPSTLQVRKMETSNWRARASSRCSIKTESRVSITLKWDLNESLIDNPLLSSESALFPLSPG
jgi:hypothetical protein